MLTKRISAKRFCERFDEALNDVSQTGCHYRVTKNGRALVTLRPIEPADLLAFAAAKRQKKQRKKR